MNDLALICVAAGRSTRLPGDVPKPFLALAGRPVYQHAIARFAHRDDLAQVVLVVAVDRVGVASSVRRDWAPAGMRADVVAGGRERCDSVRNGLAALMPEVRVVAIHDAVRPLTPRVAIDRAVRAARDHGAAIVGTPVRDTLKQATAEGAIATTVSRDRLWQAQTPQVFRRDLIEHAYATAGPRAVATDDAALVEALGERVVLVDGTAWNVKITFPDDVPLAESLLARESRGPTPTP